VCAAIAAHTTKGFIVTDKIKDAARSKLEYSTALCQHAAAMYEALTEHTRGCICREVAEQLLDLAGWPVADFLNSYENGELDA